MLAGAGVTGALAGTAVRVLAGTKDDARRGTSAFRLVLAAAAASSSTAASGTSVHLAGSVSVKVLPWPAALSTEIVPPSRRASSREIDRPSPVPP